MRKRQGILSFIIAIALCIASFIPAIPLQASSIQAPGGTMLTNNPDDAKEVFGKTSVTVSVSGQTMTIDLLNDITLNTPVILKQGNAGDQIQMNLNGHTIKGAAGIKGDDMIAATGKPALQVFFKEFDLTIQGPGSVVGGDGAVYDQGSSRCGMNGGEGILLGGTAYEYLPEKLEHGLTVDGGASIIGGAGANGSYEDWEYGLQNGSITNLSYSDRVNGSSFYCGNGGPGIGQVHSGIKQSGDAFYYLTMQERSFAKIQLVNGTVSGGKGGDFLVGNHSTNETILKNIPAMIRYNKGEFLAYFHPGDGGAGIEYYTGRKYINIASNGIVQGGMGGKIEYDQTYKLSNCVYSYKTSLFSNYGLGGNGISAYGDSGLSNDEISISGNDATAADHWTKKTANSNDVGIYIQGKVMGGNSQSTDARYTPSFPGGVGVSFIADWSKGSTSGIYEDEKWGILLLDSNGQILGGNAGNTVSGNAGNGGEGINAYSLGIEMCNNMIIKGNVSGGNGGNNKGNASFYPLAGAGGSGVYCNASLYGNGLIKGGSGGNGMVTDLSTVSGNDYHLNPVLAIDGYYEEEKQALFQSCGGSFTHGAKCTYTKKTSTGLVAQTSISSYSNYPDINTKLTCTATLPSGYSGDIFYEWRMQKYYKDPISGSRTYSIVNDSNEFMILQNDKSFAMDADLVKEIISTQHDGNYVDIYCYVMLADGRFIKSNALTINPCKVGYTQPQPVTSGGVKSLAWDKVVIYWNAPADADSIEGYTITRGMTSSTTNTYGDILIKDVKKGETLEVTDQKITCGRTYYYKIRTYDEERNSDRIYVIKVDVPDKPCPIVNSLTISQAEGKITLHWLPPEDDGTFNGYYIYRNEKQVADLSGVNTESWTDSDVEAGKTYVYYVTTRWPEFMESEPGLKVTVVAKDPNQIPCTHSDVTPVAAKEADCLNAGNSAYWICNICHEYYSSADCKEERIIYNKDSVIIPAKGHHQETITGKAATCLEKGSKDSIVCTVCGLQISGGEEIPAKGHSFVNNQCSTCGLQLSVETPAMKEEISVEGKVSDQIDPSHQEQAQEIADHVEIDKNQLIGAVPLTSLDSILNDMKLTNQNDSTMNVSVNREITMQVEVEAYDQENNSITLNLAPAVITNVLVKEEDTVVNQKTQTDSIHKLPEGKSVDVKVPLPFGQAGDAIYITLHLDGKDYLFESVIQADTNGNFYTEFKNDKGFSSMELSKSGPKPIFTIDAKTGNCTVTLGNQLIPKEEITIQTVKILADAKCTVNGRKTVKSIVTVYGKTYESEPYEVVIPALGKHKESSYTIKAGYCKDGVQGKKCSVCGKVLATKILPGYSTYYVKGLKLTKGKKAITVKWTKQSKANLKNFTGYQIQYSLKADMSAAKLVMVSKTAKSKKISKLLAKKKYYVRVRSYRAVGSKKYYSTWSPKKTVMTK